jgi:flagellar hook-length control protein FliK
MLVRRTQVRKACAIKLPHRSRRICCIFQRIRGRLCRADWQFMQRKILPAICRKPTIFRANPPDFLLVRRLLRQWRIHASTSVALSISNMFSLAGNAAGVMPATDGKSRQPDGFDAIFAALFLPQPLPSSAIAPLKPQDEAAPNFLASQSPQVGTSFCGNPTPATSVFEPFGASEAVSGGIHRLPLGNEPVSWRPAEPPGALEPPVSALRRPLESSQTSIASANASAAQPKVSIEPNEDSPPAPTIAQSASPGRVTELELGAPLQFGNGDVLTLPESILAGFNLGPSTSSAKDLQASLALRTSGGTFSAPAPSRLPDLFEPAASTSPDFRSASPSPLALVPDIQRAAASQITSNIRMSSPEFSETLDHAPMETAIQPPQHDAIAGEAPVRARTELRSVPPTWIAAMPNIEGASASRIAPNAAAVSPKLNSTQAQASAEIAAAPTHHDVVVSPATVRAWSAPAFNEDADEVWSASKSGAGLDKFASVSAPNKDRPAADFREPPLALSPATRSLLVSPPPVLFVRLWPAEAEPNPQIATVLPQAAITPDEPQNNPQTESAAVAPEPWTSRPPTIGTANLTRPAANNFPTLTRPAGAAARPTATASIVELQADIPAVSESLPIEPMSPFLKAAHDPASVAVDTAPVPETASSPAPSQSKPQASPVREDGSDRLSQIQDNRPISHPQTSADTARANVAAPTVPQTSSRVVAPAVSRDESAPVASHTESPPAQPSAGTARADVGTPTAPQGRSHGTPPAASQSESPRAASHTESPPVASQNRSSQFEVRNEPPLFTDRLPPNQKEFSTSTAYEDRPAQRSPSPPILSGESSAARIPVQKHVDGSDAPASTPARSAPASMRAKTTAKTLEVRHPSHRIESSVPFKPTNGTVKNSASPVSDDVRAPAKSPEDNDPKTPAAVKDAPAAADAKPANHDAAPALPSNTNKTEQTVTDSAPAQPQSSAAAAASPTHLASSGGAASQHVASQPASAATAPSAVAPISNVPHAIRSDATVADPSAASTRADVSMPALDVAQVAARIAAKVKEGERHFDIRLDPPELGRVDVHLSVTRDGQAEAHVVADKPQTLEALQRDQQTLHRVLKESGLDLGSNALNFSLKGQERGDGSAQRYNARASAPKTDFSDPVAPIPIVSSRAADGRIDIRI